MRNQSSRRNPNNSDENARTRNARDGVKHSHIKALLRGNKMMMNWKLQTAFQQQAAIACV